MSDVLSALMKIDAVQAVGALVTIATALQTLCLVIGVVWQPASKVAHVVGTVAVDLGKIAGLLKPSAAKLGAAISKRTGALIVLLVVLAGCSRVAHFSDPTVEQATATACDALAAQNQAEIAKQAQARGMSIAQVVSIFKTACQARALAGMKPASLRGLAAARGQLEADGETDAGAP